METAMMAPRTEFVMASVLLAALLLVIVFATVVHGGDGFQLQSVAASLKWTPAASLAALLASLAATAWHRRAVMQGKRWRAGGMTLRTLLLLFLSFPLLLAVWALTVIWVELRWAAQPASWQDVTAWLPAIIVYCSAIAVVFGAVPAFAIEYFACRRYLRRSMDATTSKP
ncbi:hypothetical protein SAMN06296416_11061 [Pseudoxanthomonas wuyuanensis]|uniref:Uncharacterized protein n=2 Tax=Pseudoxanthomonas wuyuanensis TaxID=1073196 RepID=A0A286DD75_9GAMM|nr:hypothetical protein CSC75_10115 [Pseudoxanthomonas wuyuanensis]SOD56579.1 hypothetical protein SAMN06296416_11061 [Pseudoxanthomonas wuyuanensis]